MTKEYDSRSADKFVVRLKGDMRNELKGRAKADNQTMNEAAVTAIEKYLAQGKAFDALLQIVERAINPCGGAFVTIKREHLQALVDNTKLAGTSPTLAAAAIALAELE
jgi:hypothetical protein